MNEHQADQLHAARKHSGMREGQIRAALGLKGGLKHLLPQFTITIPEGENTDRFRENMDKMEWEMPCQECNKPSRTELTKGRLLCPTCTESARGVSGR